MASITIRPIETIEDSSPPIKSRWTSAWNPIRYQFSFDTIADPTTFLLVSVYEYGTNTLLGKDTYKPKEGLLNIDISSIVRSYLYSAYEPDFTGGINYKDLGSTIKCYITYAVNTATVIGSTVSDESNYIYVSNSVKQIGEPYGQNMAEYVPYGSESVMKAKFLSKFDEPVFFVDYPFSISFIYSENIIGHELKLLEDKLNINEVFVSDDETDLDITQGHYINHLKLTAPSASISYLDISLSTGDAVDELYVYEGYVTDGYTEAR